MATTVCSAEFTAADGTEVTLRRAGDGGVLVEYGPMTLDLAMRARVHVLIEHLRGSATCPGITELTPGVRSLQVQFDPGVLPMAEVIDLIAPARRRAAASDDLVVPSRSVRLPLSWDDPATHEAIQRYMHGVRSDAPWCPGNIEFIRRINGLDDVGAGARHRLRRAVPGARPRRRLPRAHRWPLPWIRGTGW